MTSSESEKKKTDYLEVDENIPGQNYVCLSFLSPESLIQNKEAFKCVKFLQSFCKDKKLKFDDVYSSYQDFTYKYEEKLQRDFDEQNDFQTSVRGLKVRGVFDTRGAAEDRAKKLSLRDSGFHTFVGQVGYWLPWDPNADKVADEVFQDSQLNDMMEKYQENNASRDIFYEEQKRDKVNAAREEVLKAKEEELAKKKLEGGDKGADKDASEEYPIEEPIKEGTSIEDMEPEPEPEPVSSTVQDEEPETIGDPKTGSEVSDDIKDALASEDPWLQRKSDENA